MHIPQTAEKYQLLRNSQEIFDITMVKMHKRQLKFARGSLKKS